MYPPSRDPRRLPPSFPGSPEQPKSPRDRMLRQMRAHGAPIPSYIGLNSPRETAKAVAGTLIALLVLFGLLALIMVVIAR